MLQIQYHYLKKPYELIPLTAKEMPEVHYLDKLEGKKAIFKDGHSQEADVIILLSVLSSQNKNTSVFVFFKIFT